MNLVKQQIDVARDFVTSTVKEMKSIRTRTWCSTQNRNLNWAEKSM